MTNNAPHPAHTSQFRVYYEDTDAGGIVYYANYLKFAERARTDMLRAAGFDQSALKAERGLAIVVKRAAMECHAPARLDDVIAIETQLREVRGPRMTMHQMLRCGDQLLVELSVELVCVNAGLKPVRVPADIVHALSFTPLP